MYHNSIVCPVIIRLVPDCFIQSVRGKNLRPVFDQQQKYGVFRIGKLQPPVFQVDLFCIFLNSQIMEHKSFLRRFLLLFSLINAVAAEQRTHAAGQLTVGERLGEIVISAAGKSKCLITVLRTGA